MCDTCTGWRPVLVLPIPSTVVTARPCIEQIGAKQAFTEKCLWAKIIFEIEIEICLLEKKKKRSASGVGNVHLKN